MPMPEGFEDGDRELRLRAVPGVPMAPGSAEPFIGRDEAALLADSSIERINTVPVGAPDIIVED